METNQVSATLQVPHSTPVKLWDACQDKLQGKLVLGDMINYVTLVGPPPPAPIFYNQTEFISSCCVSEKKQICEVKTEKPIP